MMKSIWYILIFMSLAYSNGSKSWVELTKITTTASVDEKGYQLCVFKGKSFFTFKRGNGSDPLENQVYVSRVNHNTLQFEKDFEITVNSRQKSLEPRISVAPDHIMIIYGYSLVDTAGSNKNFLCMVYSEDGEKFTSTTLIDTMKLWNNYNETILRYGGNGKHYYINDDNIWIINPRQGKISRKLTGKNINVDENEGYSASNGQLWFSDHNTTTRDLKVYYSSNNAETIAEIFSVKANGTYTYGSRISSFGDTAIMLYMTTVLGESSYHKVVFHKGTFLSDEIIDVKKPYNFSNWDEYKFVPFSNGRFYLSHRTGRTGGGVLSSLDFGQTWTPSQALWDEHIGLEMTSGNLYSAFTFANDSTFIKFASSNIDGIRKIGLATWVWSKNKAIYGNIDSTYFAPNNFYQIYVTARSYGVGSLCDAFLSSDNGGSWQFVDSLVPTSNYSSYIWCNLDSLKIDFTENMKLKLVSRYDGSVFCVLPLKNPTPIIQRITSRTYQFASIINHQLQIHNNTPFHFTIYDIRGRALFDNISDKSVILLDKLGLSSGLYLIRISQGVNVITGQFVLK